jgi:PEP-CTERM motif
MKRNQFLPALVAATLAVSATPALADAITLDNGAIGQSYTFTYNGFADSTVVNGLTASTTFTLTGISGNQYQFSYSVTNTTDPTLTSRISSFGFNTNPDITGATSTGAFSYTTLDSSYPNGIGAIDVCFKDAKTGSCSGGGSGGLTAGQTGTGSFSLTFSQPITSLTLSDFYVRYQSITGAGNITSASGAGTLTGSSSTSGGSTSTGGTDVPEPGMLGLLGISLLGLGLARRRRRVLAA